MATGTLIMPLAEETLPTMPPAGEMLPALGGTASFSTTDARLAGVSNKSHARLAIALACTACRSRHLKCDGQQPCSRCSDDGAQCNYVKSRRGYKGPRRASKQNGIANGFEVPAKRRKGTVDSSDSTNGSNGVGRTVSTNSNGNSNGFPTPEGVTAALYTLPQQMPPAHGMFSTALPSTPFSDAEIASVLSATSLPSELTDPAWPGSLFLNSYFEQFHPCHPFLLPRPQMMEVLRTRNLPHLVAAMEFMGSFYHPSSATTAALNTLNQMLPKVVVKDGFFVQASLLLVTGLQVSGRVQECSLVMASVLELAKQLGMDRREYAWVNGEGSPVMEESWRRTWWEVFTINGVVEGMNGVNLSIYDENIGCLLPCEELEYATGQIPPPKSLQDLDDADFLEEEDVFSSFTYRIDAIRRFGFINKTVRLDPMRPDLLDLAETALANWYLQLPPSKKDVMDHHGNLDEIMFQAHLLAAASGVLLNRPRSDLNLQDVITVRICANGSPRDIPGDKRHLYTAKALHYAQAMTKLALLPTPLLSHSPFFSCILVSATIIYLAYWSLCSVDGSDEFIKAQIKVSIRSLKEMSEVWPVAEQVYGQVKIVAKELYAARKTINSANWGAITGGEIFQGFVDVANSGPPYSESSENTSDAASDGTRSSVERSMSNGFNDGLTTNVERAVFNIIDGGVG